MSLETFLTQFYPEYNDITSKIEALQKVDSPEKKLQLSTEYESLSNRTLTLQKYFTENTKFIPAYETRKAQEHLAKLAKIAQEKREQIFPKKKFGFKSKQKMTSLADAINTANEIDEQKPKPSITDNEEIFYKGIVVLLTYYNRNSSFENTPIYSLV